MNSRHVAIVGAGVVGACTALMLQRYGHAVTIIDPNPPGEGASYGNAGCFNGSSIVPMAMPGIWKDVPRWLVDPMGPLSVRWSYLPKIAPWLVRFLQSGTPKKVAAQAAALRGLLEPTVELMTSLAKEAGADDLVRHEGHVYVYRSEEGFRKDQGGWALRQANGVKLQMLDQAALRDFDPALSPNFVRGVFIEENGHTTNPSKLVKRLVEQAVRNGGSFLQASATCIVLDGDNVRAVQTSSGEVAADCVVIAAGAHSKMLAEQMGDRVMLDTERGYHLMIRDPEVKPRVPTTEAEGKFVVNAMEEGLRFAGTVELGGLDLPPDWRRARMLLDQARLMLPGLSATYPEERLTQWMGFRPSLPDSLPVIGRSSRSPGVLYGFGHGHVGMTGAPMTAKLLASSISGENLAVDISAFSPQRFQTNRAAA
ncbi:NAD(P)/FAD-dependent oxidoreductase [Pseudorhodoplanes sp.]|uniref:NAD(P)/FAD-dependent oxidoreductase n=1 Tax=Pseudorhodoplanes sp. TaxID=1934341 RepID=UPI003D116B64